MTSAVAPPPAAPPPRRRGPSRIVAWGLASGIALALTVVAAFTWLSSEHALRTVLDIAAQRSGGRLALEGVTGSLTGRLAVERIRWHDDGTGVVADNVVLVFAPAALLRGRVAIRDATAQRLSLALPPGDGTPLELPASIGLPLALDVDRLAVGTIEWRAGDERGTLSDLSLAYSGDGAGHRLRDLRVRAEGATLAGAARVGAAKPFDLDASLVLDLAAPHPAGRIEAKARGSLEALAVEGASTVAGVNAQARVDLAPLASQPIVAAQASARDLDLSALDSAWPVTRLEVVVDAAPAPDGFSGTLEARNGAAGPLDRNRVPLERFTSEFALAGRVLSLTRIAAQVPGGGTLDGSGVIELDGWRNRWKLAIAGLDLSRVHGALRVTRLAGRLDADVQGAVQRVTGDVAQDDIRLAFEALYDGTTLVAERFAAQARGGSLVGTGRVALTGDRAFVVDAKAQRFDPSRFGDFPAGTIDGTLRAEGKAAGTPSAQADVVIAPGSLLAGLPLQGRVRGRFTEHTAEALDAHLTLGATRFAAAGAINRRGQPLSVTFASSRLAELAPLLPPGVPAMGGALEASVRVEPRERGAAVTVDARGTTLAVGGDWSAETIRVKGRGVHAAPLQAPRLDAIGELDVDVAATGVVAPQGRLDVVKVSLEGSAGAHTLAVAATQGPQSIDLSARGSLVELATAPQWRGRVESLTALGVPGFARLALAAPADLEVVRDGVRVGAARIEGGGTQVEIDGIALRDGRLETRGRFRGLPIEPYARLAGLESRWPSDVVVGGQWNVVSVPQWKGTISIERERGDVYVDEPADEGRTRLALGLSTLRFDASIDGPRLAAHGEIRARLGGNTLIDVTADAAPGSLHPFRVDARLGGTVRAHVPSLASLQPWIGTAARVQGQAIAEVNLAGTTGDPAFTGQLVGYGLRVDMPQLGINLANGRLRVVSGAEGIRLEELEFAGGDGRFTATGTIALPRERGGKGGTTRIAWRAQDFRALNHPDRRLVVDGEGTLGMQQGRWLLEGRLAIDEGVIAYRSTADTVLADDIVVVGRPRPARSQSVATGADAPLDIDLAIELGRNFRFSGEGLDTRLAGRLQIASRRGEPISGKGTIRTSRGTFYAFGQRLTIDRGRVIFDGPVANPALDIVALRKNLAVEAGVAISGTVRAPVVRLTSNPPVPDNEKLSWLLTGGPPGSATQTEAIALQAAQAALAGRGGKPLAQQFAQSVGVDDISVVQRGSSTGDDLLSGQVMAVGKRITDRVYIAYEQGLDIATNALRIEYVLSRFFTVSAYAGTTSGIELKFRRNWR